MPISDITNGAKTNLLQSEHKPKKYNAPLLKKSDIPMKIKNENVIRKINLYSINFCSSVTAN